MLFKEIHLQGIRSGTIRLAFRRWVKASVKNGSLMKTSIGLVEVVNISAIEENNITGADIIDAGFESREQLLRSLRPADNGSLYRIEVRYHSEDPRTQIREQTHLTSEDFSILKKKVERLDNYSKQGHWTRKVLLTIRDNPHRKAAELSRLTGWEKEWLKLNIRKLKNSGLTISHQVGYELSPMGKVFVEKLLNESSGPNSIQDTSAEVLGPHIQCIILYNPFSCE